MVRKEGIGEVSEGPENFELNKVLPISMPVLWVVRSFVYQHD
ncbi:MAG: hypothetical protein AAF519_03855 [Bacteroidota bacterium]